MWCDKIEWYVTSYFILAYFSVFEHHARSILDPRATPTPIATEADRHPLPDLNRRLPTTAPVAAPIVALIIPTSIEFSIPSGNFQLLWGSWLGLLFISLDIMHRKPG